MEAVNLRKHAIRAEDVLPTIAAPGQRLFYLSPGSSPVQVGAFTPDYYLRVVLIPRLNGVEAMAAAVRGWCEEAALQVGFPVAALDVQGLVDPGPTQPWAAVPAARRAGLLTLAIDFLAQHAIELGVFDLGDFDAQRLLTGARIERALGLPTMDGAAIDHIFFGMMARMAERATGQVLALAPAGDDQGWRFREVFSQPGAIWRRGLVLGPLAAVPGLGLAALAERVVAQLLARRHANFADLHAQSGRLLAPAIEAALRAGVPVLAPRLSDLLGARTGPELH